MKLGRNLYLWSGFNIRMISNIISIPKRYVILKKEAKKLLTQYTKDDEFFPICNFYPCLLDKNEEAGSNRGGYFWQDLICAQKIFINRPECHIDIGSRIDGFVTHVASFRKIYVLDIRPLSNIIPNVTFKQCDIMDSQNIEKECTDSISCLHCLEHFGLGRYGDPLCYNGHLIGFNNIYAMLKPKGKFYFSVPLGIQRLEFNAHRIFSLRFLISLISPYFEIDNFSYIDEKGNLNPDVEISNKLIESNCGCNGNGYGVAVFELTKK